MRGSDSMNDLTLLGPWVRRFLLEHLVAERNLARNTQRSYRDALTLLIPFVADRIRPVPNCMNRWNRSYDDRERQPAGAIEPAQNVEDGATGRRNPSVMAQLFRQ